MKINFSLLIEEILASSEGIDGVSKKEIVIHYNLESQLVEKVLNLLDKKGLIEPQQDSDRWSITNKGRQCVEDYNKLSQAKIF